MTEVMTRSCARRATAIVATVCAGAAWGQGLPVEGEGTGPVDRALQLGPVPGFTTAWHPAPAMSAAPLGATLVFRIMAPEAAKVTWTGAIEIAHEKGWSTATCPLTTLDKQTVHATVTVDGETFSDSMTIDPMDVDPSVIVMAPITVDATAVVPPPMATPEQLNDWAVETYFGGSIAAIRAAGEGRWVTSVARRIAMATAATPVDFAPLTEWRVDGEAVALGGSAPITLSTPGLHRVSAGPPATAAAVTIETYAAAIERRTRSDFAVDGVSIPEDVRTAFEVVTTPPGYEDQVTWLAATKYGSAVPTMGAGAAFEAVFQATYGPWPTGGAWQWLGVRADNATQGQDQKTCGADSFCESDTQCVFFGIDNASLGAATLSLNEDCNLVISNIGSSGKDGVVQTGLSSTQMVTGLACPNFAASIEGTSALVNMIGDIGLISTFTAENVNGQMVVAQGDFSPVGATSYTVQVMLGEQMIAEFPGLPKAIIQFPAVDLEEIDCLIEPECHISFDLTMPVPIQVIGGGALPMADVVWIIAENPTLNPTVQTAIENFFANTGDIEMTFQYAGPATCGFDNLNSCFMPHPGPGCQQLLCCGAVCEIDPFCCDVAWDQMCVDLALEICVP